MLLPRSLGLAHVTLLPAAAKRYSPEWCTPPSLECYSLECRTVLHSVFTHACVSSHTLVCEL